MPETDAWTQADRLVLAALTDTPQTATELPVDLPPAVKRAVLAQNARAGFAAVHRDASRTRYTITDAGKRHVESVMEVA
jgi:hypothetical protein